MMTGNHRGVNPCLPSTAIDNVDVSRVNCSLALTRGGTQELGGSPLLRQHLQSNRFGSVRNVISEPVMSCE